MSERWASEVASLAMIAASLLSRGNAEAARAKLEEAARLARGARRTGVPLLDVHDDVADLLEALAEAAAGSAPALAEASALMRKLNGWSRRLFGSPCVPPGAEGAGGVLPARVIADGVATCMFRLKGFLSSSRCRVEEGASPAAVRACHLADYAFRVLEREGMLYRGAPEPWSFLGSWAPPAPPRGSRWAAVLAGEKLHRLSVLDQLSARAVGSSVVLDLDYGKRAVVDFGRGEVVVSGVAAHAARAVAKALEEGADLRCEVRTRGRRAAVRCTGVTPVSADRAVAAAAAAANVGSRLLWHNHPLGAEDAGEVARELARRIERELLQR